MCTKFCWAALSHCEVMQDLVVNLIISLQLFLQGADFIHLF